MSRQLAILKSGNGGAVVKWMCVYAKNDGIVVTDDKDDFEEWHNVLIRNYVDVMKWSMYEWLFITL